MARYLISRGCRTDLLMASALGNLDLVRYHLDRDPDCIRMNVSAQWFPKQDPRADGTIYIWTFGPNRTVHRVVRDFGHEHVFRLLAAGAVIPRHAESPEPSEAVLELLP